MTKQEHNEYQKAYNRKNGYKSVGSMHKKRFGGLRDFILTRDGNKCVMCGMTNKEHLALWERSLTINHIDHQGRYAKVANNDPENLETLCLRCHGRKDQVNYKQYLTVS